MCPISSKNFYFLAGKLLVLFYMIELIGKYFLTWSKLRIYYKSRKIFREHLSEEIPDKEEAIRAKIKNDFHSTVEKYQTEINKLIIKGREKEYNNLNDFYEHKRDIV